MQYIRCPRCELNFILKKDKLCSVCKREIESAYKNDEDDGDIDLGVDFEICPICKTNYIREDEDMCASCQKERELDRALNGGDLPPEEEDFDNYENDTLKDDDEFGDMMGISDEDDLGADLDDLDIDIGIDDDVDFDDDELDDLDEDFDDDDDEDDDEEDDFDDDLDDLDDEDDDDEDDNKKKKQSLLDFKLT